MEYGTSGERDRRWKMGTRGDKVTEDGRWIRDRG